MTNPAEPEKTSPMTGRRSTDDASRRLKPKSLRAKFFAINIPLALASLGLLFIVYQLYGNTESYETFLARADRLIDSQSKVLEPSVWNLDIERVRLLTDSLAVNPDVAGVAVYDNFGERLAVAGTLDAKNHPELLKTHAMTFRNGDDVEEIGKIRILFSNEAFERTRARELRIGLTVAIVVLLTTVISAVVAYRRTIDVPMRKLLDVFVDETSALEQRRVQWRSDDEMGALIDAFNTMQTRREDAETALKESYDQLEERVRKRTQELARARDEARAADRAKSEFLATMSHEIRTPMTGVLGLSDMLLDAEPTPEQRDYILKIQTATKSLVIIINDILDLSKLEAGKLEIETVDFDFSDILDECITLIEPNIDEQGLSLTVMCDDRVPDRVHADPVRLRQVLINLLGNAVKFTHEGSIGIEVALESENAGERTLKFTITDTGIGIPSDQLNNLFSEFTQADTSSSRRYEGTGLGLAISKRLVSLMGGEIGVESSVGQGSTFWFTTRVEAVTDVLPGATATPQGTASESFEGTRHLEILMAEDNKLNQMILQATIDQFGHRVDIVENGRQAVEAVAGGNYDLVLMDIRMPEMNGTDAARIIRARADEKARIPIIAVTADVVKEKLDEYMAAGMNACVTKPIDRAELARTINDVLGEEVHRAENLAQQPGAA